VEFDVTANEIKSLFGLHFKFSLKIIVQVSIEKHENFPSFDNATI